MALVKNVEKRIWDIEGFAVTIRHADGRDMRGDRQGLPMYSYERMAKNSHTVSAWKEQRFANDFPGYSVDVLYSSGETVVGNTLLSTVRDSYFEE
jgi:O-succinylbenzoate synthase